MPPSEAAVSHAAYGLLRWGFYAGLEGAWEVVRSPEWLDAVEGTLQELGVADATALVDRLMEGVASFRDREEWEGCSNALFGPAQRCPPCETDHTSANPFTQANELADVRGFYQAFGLEPSSRSSERADHVALEMEYLYLLGHRAGDAARRGDSEGEEILLLAGRRFLEAHLGRFAAAFSGRLAAAGAHPFFVALGTATERVVAADVKRLELRPAPLPKATGTMDEPDEPECGACPAPREREAVRQAPPLP